MTPLEIPAVQQQPPAGNPIIPLRPACAQLSSQPGSVDGWSAWGVTVDGVFQQFVGLPATLSRNEVNAAAQAYGLCVVEGVEVPLSYAELAAVEPPQITETTAQVSNSIPVNDDPVGLTPALPFPLLMGAAIVGAIAAVNWIRENANKRNSDVDVSPESLYPLVGQTEPVPWGIANSVPGFVAPEAPGFAVPDMRQVYPQSMHPPVPTHTPETPEGGTEGGEGGPLRGETAGGVNPLNFCPLKLEEFPSEIEIAALTFCCYEDYSQNKALEAVYGLTSNNRNSAAYERAVSRWKAFKKQWLSKYNLGA